MKCLSELLHWLKNSFPSKGSFAENKSLPLILTQDEYVARFIFNQRDLFQDGTPKPKLFMPEKGSGEWETSVCRKTHVSENRMRELCGLIRDGLCALGWADLRVSIIRESKLTAKAAPEPKNNYREHAVIIDWPIGEEAKARQKDLATNLAAQANVVRPGET
jgi:hypothetical protein